MKIEVTTDSTEITSIIRDYYDQLYVNKWTTWKKWTNSQKGTVSQDQTRKTKKILIEE